jgi:hypothetical protein
MKHLFTILLLYLICPKINAQKGSITIRNNFFSSARNSEIIDLDTLLVKPEDATNFKSYGFDIAYRRELFFCNWLIISTYLFFIQPEKRFKIAIFQ